MPELPEVETSRRGISPYILNNPIIRVQIHQPRLRWPIPQDLGKQLQGQQFTEIERRAKYLLCHTAETTLLLHLGMSGSLRILEQEVPRLKHDHIEWHFQSGHILRFNDPRRFGAVLSCPATDTHPLLAKLGPEPLSDAFDGDYLYQQSRKRKAAVKTYIMDNQVVVGVGNIYASESLFMAGIDPRRPANQVSLKEYLCLSQHIKQILAQAIRLGGSTLRDFVNSDGKPGYFQQTLNVYSRDGQDCKQCQQPLQLTRLGQRASVYCPQCQR